MINYYENKKGFITIAIGNKKYIEQALNLLLSYRAVCEKPLPFCLITDLDEMDLSLFDDIVKVKDLPASYLSKLFLNKLSPYEQTIFIDADCLAFQDLNILFGIFNEHNEPFSGFGRVLPLDAKDGWFQYDKIGELKDKVSYISGFHSGILYFKKCSLTSNIFDTASKFLEEYEKYHFYPTPKPCDEAVFALSMAVHGLKPIVQSFNNILCDWEHPNSLGVDINSHYYKINGENIHPIVVHWGGGCLNSPFYKKQVSLLKYRKYSIKTLIFKTYYDAKIYFIIVKTSIKIFLYHLLKERKK